jgi:hypothetical protein
MRTLLLAAILYLIGVVVILLLRPSIMFDEDGHWKEFGSLSRDHTIFPFWLFCITWAVVSYCITLFMMGSSKVISAKVEVDEPTTTHPRSKKSRTMIPIS